MDNIDFGDSYDIVLQSKLGSKTQIWEELNMEIQESELTEFHLKTECFMKSPEEISRETEERISE